MSKIKVVVQTKNAAADTTMTAAKLTIAMGVFTYSSGAGMTAADLISADTPNDLKIGSDNRLVSQPPDSDFLADYILASN